MVKSIILYFRCELQTLFSSKTHNHGENKPGFECHVVIILAHLIPSK